MLLEVVFGQVFVGCCLGCFWLLAGALFFLDFGNDISLELFGSVVEVLIEVFDEVERRAGLFSDDLLLRESDLLSFFGQIFTHTVANRSFPLFFVFLGFFELLFVELSFIHLTQLPLHVPHNTGRSDLPNHFMFIVERTMVQLRFAFFHRAVLFKTVDWLF